MEGIRELTASDSGTESGLLSGFYSGHPAVSYIMGRKSSENHLRLAFRNCIVTSCGAQRIFSDSGFRAFVHICAPGSWGRNLHEFILRGTMKIPFAIDSGTISRLAAYRDACLGISPGEGFSHVAAVCWESGAEDAAHDLLLESMKAAGGRFFAVAHTESESEFFSDAGFRPYGSADFAGIGLTSMVR